MSDGESGHVVVCDSKTRDTWRMFNSADREGWQGWVGPQVALAVKKSLRWVHFTWRVPKPACIAL